MKFLKVCDTRWISLEPAVRRILQQWDELKLHFQLIQSTENCYTAEMLFQMYSDLSNKLYFTYLLTVLSEVQRTTKAFEAENNDPTRLLDDLINLSTFVSKKIIIPTARIYIFSETTEIDSYVDPKPYLGYEFEKLAVMIDLRAFAWNLKKKTV